MQLITETLDRCPVCGSGDLTLLRTAPDYESHSGEFGIQECAGCGVAFTNPRPCEGELPKLYEQRSSADFPRAAGFVRRLRDRKIDHYLAGQLGQSLARNGGSFKVLDYGCGDGALVRGLVRIGRKANRQMQITGVDFHEVAPPAIVDAGTEAAYRTNAEWHRDPGQYDAIFLRHVLEHHPQPLRLLADLGRALRTGGTLYIEVPNRRSMWAGIFGRYYSGYYLPRHLFHFDRASLDRVLRLSGFHDTSVQLAHHPMIGGSLRYMTGLGSGNTSLVGLAGYPIQIGVDALCGRSTTLLATATGHG